MSENSIFKGPIAWMAHHRVASNLLMICLLAGGLFMLFNVKQEVFPEFELDMVIVSVPYPGASPEEVEQGVVLAVEEKVRGVDGVKRVTSLALEGAGLTYIEIEEGVENMKALQDIKNGIDAITSLPEESERPIVSLLTNQREVINLVLYGQLEEKTLRGLAEEIRFDLLSDPLVTLVELSGVPALEIGVEISQEQLRAYGLSLEGVAAEIRRTALELPGGGVKTPGGEVLLRTTERRDLGDEFADVPIVNLPDGTLVTLGEIARIKDGFAETDQTSFFNGQPAIMIKVFRTGEQTPIEIAETVKARVTELNETLPEGANVAVWSDRSQIYRDRIDLLLRNAKLGLVLVMLILGFFLEARLAFWVTMGIPISFMGAILFMPAVGLSFNMISLFAFIVTLGLVVDDAIVVGENIYEYRQRGVPFMKAAVLGAREVAMPVTFAILTNIVAFMPLLFVTGRMGKFFYVIPAIVIMVFIISLIECLFILPAHLGHLGEAKNSGARGWLHRFQQRFSRWFERFVENVYGPAVRISLEYRYLTIATGTALLLLVMGVVVGGRIDFSFLPKVESDQVSATLEMPYGSPVDATDRVRQRVYSALLEVIEANGGEAIVEGIFTQVGSSANRGGAAGPSRTSGGSHLANVQVALVPSDQRELSAAELEKAWRKKVGNIPGLESLIFKSQIGPSAGSPIDIELSHTDVATLERAAEELAGRLGDYAGLLDIDDGVKLGKSQLSLTIRPEARSLGLRPLDLARQMRSAFYGAEALRQQRGRNEVRVMVRRPKEERESEHYIESLVIRTPVGGEIPLGEAAEIKRGRAYTEIKRADGKRVVNVTSDLTQGVTTAKMVLADLEKKVLPELMERYSGLSYSLEGEERERKDSLQSLFRGFLMAQLAIFTLLAIPFRSYIQPLIVMVAIPFGLVGAVSGHMLLGYELSIVSMMGIVALTGVVVNDSLILVVYANNRRDEGEAIQESIALAGVRRFRPILLTSLTTFFGLLPMIFEPSVQARFLVPMAISLGFGVLFSTVIVLLLVPSLYLIAEDVRDFFGFSDHAIAKERRLAAEGIEAPREGKTDIE